MEITIYAKKRTTSLGKVFFTYLSQLTDKEGNTKTVSVKFRDDAGDVKPEMCPKNIVFDKADANLSKKTTTDKDTGEVYTNYTLWISKFTDGEPYVDHSLDEF